MPKRLRPVRRRWRRPVLFLLFAGIIAGAFYYGISSHVRTAMFTVCEYQSKIIGSMAITQAVTEELGREDQSYEQLMHIAYDESGNVVSIESDMVRINQLKAGITERVQESLARRSQQPVPIPLGTLVGSQLLAGRGPAVDFILQPIGYPEVEITSEFTEAGINQTLHQVMLQVRTEVNGLVPGCMVGAEITTNYCIAETVIVGTIPDAYTKVYDGYGSDLSSTIFDHQAEPTE
jgi:sporulation protein YunB